jgi:acyl-CoA thioesterase
MAQDEIAKARQRVQQMYRNDLFSQWLGIDVLEVRPGSCRITMTVREEMANGFGMAHGGITFSLADSAFAFASNSRGPQAVSIETSISHLRPVFSGETLVALARELHRSRSLGRYAVDIFKNGQDRPTALFTGTVFIKNDSL